MKITPLRLAQGYLKMSPLAEQPDQGSSGGVQSLLSVQQETCRRFGASFLAADDWRMVGLSKNFDPKQFPLNGLRHPPEGQTNGWYIWSSEEFSDEDDFFEPVHTVHLVERCPQIMKYLGLGPGWRFLYAPGYEDVWYDANLLNI